MKRNELFKLIPSILLPLKLGAFAGTFAANAIPLWYASLNRPSFNPPNWLFGHEKPSFTEIYLNKKESIRLITVITINFD